ncbi:MAG: response regulator [Treponema sp.]|jgi:signal transduction histidine kinase/CheY-like chemotaxis protein/HPt (histidine-containing phosphotransfer) domain-containing protein|nr:response regulator [Treponema sp.]
MKYLLLKAKELLAKYTQVLFVIIAFALMVIFSYYFMREAELKHLRENTLDAIRFTEANIKSDMLEPETLLGGISETVREMIINGAGKKAVNDYLLFTNRYVDDSEGNILVGVTGFFGVFDIFNNDLLMGEEAWSPPDRFEAASCPWYTGAVKASGKVYTTEPYFNEFSREISITLSRRIFGKDNEPLGIICVNIDINRVARHALSASFSDNGYGFLLCQNQTIIAHPNLELLGKTYNEMRTDISSLTDVFREEGGISEFVIRDYRGVQSIVFVRGLENGWYMGMVTPRANYFKNINNLLAILIILGTIFAIFLIWIILNVFTDKEKVMERMQIMFNETPLAATFLDKNLSVIDCNQNAVEMFALSSFDEYKDRFFDLLPEYQPDGEKSKEKLFKLIFETLERGVTSFNWQNQKLDGEIIPCKVTLVRTKYKSDYIIVVYTRDLREEVKLQMVSEQQVRLLDTVNTTAAILLASNESAAFEASLLRCFDLIGQCLDVDRVEIWRNEAIDDEPHFVLRYEWLSNYGKNRRPIPIGLHFPYSMKKDWAHKFMNGEHINAPIAMLSEEDKSFLGYYEIKSIVMIPMFLENDFWGFFSINDCRKERIFSDEEISILTSAGLMMSSAINHNMQTVKMREAEERTRLMLDAAPMAALIWDKNLKIIDCNREAYKMFGLPGKQEFIDKFVMLSPEYQSDGIPSTEKNNLLVRKAFEEGYSRFEWMHQKPDGEPMPSDIICVRVKHKEEWTVTEYIRDLREQKAIIAEMRKAEIAEESSKAKSDFLAKMSHEIRTPMNSILGIAEIQLQDDTHPSITREAFERISNSGDLLLGIINDILDLSKIEAGKLVLIPSRYEVASLINDTVQLNIMRYESKPIEFILDVDENLPLMFIGDELRIKQILNNLLSNAFKYTQEGKITMSVYAELEDSENNSKRMLVFAVKDTGQGMTTEQVRKLGTEYSRFNMEANRKTEGTGLGMNITRNLVELMSGNIVIESVPGAGSTFTVLLPQEVASDETLGKELADNLMQLNADNSLKTRSSQMKRDFMPYGRVLVVDDVETNIYVAKGLMAPYGLSIETAMSGFESIDKIREGKKFDIIFMDHMMPRMDGIEAAKIIRSLGYTGSIVALTANALSGQAEMFLENGFDDFISKPIDIRQLNMVLNKLVRDKQPAEIVEAARKQKDTLIFGNGAKKQVDRQLAEIFIRDARKVLKVMEAIYMNKCRRADDLSIFIINVHSMKSALANVGEKNLSDEAAKLEKAGREQDLKKILSELPSFMEMLYIVISKFEAKDEFPVQIEEDDKKFLHEKLVNIKEACQNMEKKTAKKEISLIKEKRWPSDINEQLGKISEHLLHSDFEEAVKIIETLLA